MQTLYTMAALDKEVKAGEPQKTLQSHFNQSRSLLIYLTWFLTEIARYAETESHKRASKHLPSKDDLNVNVKLAGNELLWKLLEDAALKEQFKNEKPELILRSGQGEDILVYISGREPADPLGRSAYAADRQCRKDPPQGRADKDAAVVGEYPCSGDLSAGRGGRTGRYFQRFVCEGAFNKCPLPRDTDDTGKRTFDRFCGEGSHREGDTGDVG